MKDIILSALLLTMISILARTVLPKIQLFVKWIIKVLVNFAEKRIKGSGLGKQKKVKVLKWLKWFGIHTSDFVDELIENTVDVMNNKRSEIKTEIQEDISSKIKTGVDELTSKITNK